MLLEKKMWTNIIKPNILCSCDLKNQNQTELNRRTWIPDWILHNTHKLIFNLFIPYLCVYIMDICGYDTNQYIVPVAVR